MSGPADGLAAIAAMNYAMAPVGSKLRRQMDAQRARADRLAAIPQDVKLAAKVNRTVATAQRALGTAQGVLDTAQSLGRADLTHETTQVERAAAHLAETRAWAHRVTADFQAAT